MGRLVFAAFYGVLVLASCGGDDSCPGCVEDAGRADGGALDGGPADSGTDAAVTDGGGMDGLVPDAFMADGFVPDAFVADGGPPAGPCSGGTGDHTIVTGEQHGLPRILWTGSDYAVAYFGREAAGAAFESFVGRVDAMGSVTTVPARVTPDDGELSIWVRIAQSDVGFGVVYLDDRGATRQVYFARLDATGALVAGSEEQLSDPSETVAVHAIAHDPITHRFGVAWVNRDDEIHFARISESGTILAPPSGSSVVDSGTFGYTGTPLIWADDHFAIVSSPLSVTEIASDGTVTRSGDIEASTVLHRPAIAWSGTGYAVVWRQSSDQSIRFTRVDGSGRVSGSDVTLHPGPIAGEPDIAWADTGEWGVTWAVGDVSNPSDIHFARLAPDGTIRANGVLVSGSTTDWWPQLTWCGQYAIVYEHGRADVDGLGELHLNFP